jgi:hypothetical protein
MVPHRFAGFVRAWVLSLAILTIAPATLAQSLPGIRTTMVARNTLEPSPCFEFGCFNRSSYDANMLAALGAQLPHIYVFLRISAGPWYEAAVLRNVTPLPAGYDAEGYRWPIAVVGDEILATAYQSGPSVPTTCVTHLLTRSGTRWTLKQVIDVCATQFAKDDNRVLFGTNAAMPIYVRGSNGLYTEESRVLPPSEGFFNATKSLALNNWTVVVGTPQENSGVGAAHVFQRREGQWVLSKTLTPDGAGAGTGFGTAVSVYEYNVAIGAPGAVPSSGTGRGLVYMYTGVGENWAISQELAEPLGSDSNFGTSLALRDRRLVVSAHNNYPFFEGPKGFLFERGLRESTWVARGTLAGDGMGTEISGNTVMVDVIGARFGTFPTVVNLPALREPDVAP